jgi:hypothetical protein
MLMMVTLNFAVLDFASHLSLYPSFPLMLLTMERAAIVGMASMAGAVVEAVVGAVVLFPLMLLMLVVTAGTVATTGTVTGAATGAATGTITRATAGLAAEVTKMMLVTTNF